MLEQSRTRLIEVVECDLGKDGLIGVVESVHPRRWTSIARYVVLDVLGACEAIVLARKNPIEIAQSDEFD